MTRSTVAAVALIATMTSAPAFAAEETTAKPPHVAATSDIGTVSSNVLWIEGNVAARRPSILPALYVSYAALQAYDVYSTRRGLALGAREANPLMQPAVGNTGTLVALKAGVGVATIVAAERLWRTNKPAAVVVMIAGNTVAAMVAARNARTLAKLH